METVSQGVTTFLVNALWQIPLLVAAAALAARLMRSSPARYHYSLWLTALGLSLALPLASLRVIGVNAPPVRAQTAATPNAAAARNAVATQSSLGLPAAWAGRPEASVVPPAGLVAPWPASENPWNPPALPISARAARYVTFGFLILLMIRLTRLAEAWRRTRAIRRGARPAPLTSRAAETVERLRRAFSLGETSVLFSREVSSPLTLGAPRPVIVLPEGFLERSSPAELAAALGHEMAHVARRDYLFNLIAELVALPISFHPAAGLILRRVRESREFACDELAAKTFVAPASYAQSLVAIARRLAVSPRQIQPGYSLGVFDANNLEERIMRLLHPLPSGSARAAKALLVAGSFLMLAAFAAAAGFPLRVAETEPASKVSPKQFAGTWTAQFEGKTYIILDLKQNGDAVGGTVSLGNFGVDEDGQVNRVQDEPRPDYAEPIVSSRLEGDTETLTAKGKTGNLNVLQIKLVSEGEAKIKLLPPAGEPFADRLAWWTIKRTRAKGENEVRPGGPSGGVLGGVPGGVPSGLEAFVGTWRGTFHDRPFVKLALGLEGDHLRGTMTSFSFRLDDEGNLIKAEGKDEIGWKVVDATVEGGVLHLKCQEATGTTTGTADESSSNSGRIDEFELNLTGNNEGEFRPLGAPFPVKPWKLVRSEGGAVLPKGPEGGKVGGVPGGVSGGVEGRLREVKGTITGVLGGAVVDGSGAQEIRGTIKGTVTDPSGARVPNAVLSLIGQAGGFNLTVATDHNGEFVMAQVPAGSYRIVVSHAGFERAEGPVDMIGPETTARLNVILGPAKVDQIMRVTAKRPAEVQPGSETPSTVAIRVGGQVGSARLLHKTEPQYPESERSKGIQGDVVLEAVISMEGVPLSIKTISSPGEDFTDAAVKAVKQWRYQPTTLNGEPVEVVTDITVQFTLEN